MIRLLLLLLSLTLVAPAAMSADDPYEDMMVAIKNEHLATVKKLIARGMGVDTVDEAGSSLLMLSSRSGSQEIVDYLIKAGAKVNYRNRFGDSALMWAAMEGQLPICKTLVEHGAEFENDGWTPLHYAASKGRDEVIEYLLSLDVDIDATSDNGTTPLMMAAEAGQSRTVKLLLAHKAEVNLQNQSGITAMYWAQARHNTDIVKLLKAAGATR